MADTWEDDEPDARREPEQLVLDIDGFEGPLDLLLMLARDQKVDLVHLSILKLADQYLGFIGQARRIKLELAADYLVMAAWLAYLKSRLLLPEPEEDGDPSGPELAEELAFRLRRLEAMREAGGKLMARHRLGIDFFERGAPEGVQIVKNPVFELSLFDVLKAYGEQKRRTESGTLEIEALNLYSMDDALVRLREILPNVPDWRSLQSFLPRGIRNALIQRSAIATMFAASLELTREGMATIRQGETFGPIYIRSAGNSGAEIEGAR